MKALAFDLETALIRSGVLAPEIACLSWAESPDAKGLLVDLPAIRKFIEAALQGGAVLVGANVAYDFGCLLAEWPDLLPLVWAKYERGEVRDVLIRQTLTAIAEGRLRDGELLARNGLRMTDGKGRMTSRYSLDVCVKEVLGRTNAKENDSYRLRYGELIGVPLAQWPPEARQYPVDDALNTLLVHLGQTDEHGKDAAAQTHTALCLHLASMWGIRTDPERVGALKGRLAATLKSEKAWAIEAKLVRPDGTKDMTAIREAVGRAYGGHPPTTDKGGVSTSRETLAESGDATLERFSEISKTEKLLTYIPSLEEASKVPLNVRCNVLLATGRASYEGVIQLLPRKGGVRECFKARGVFSSVDYAAIELSALAQVCLNMGIESKLADAINAGMDPHSILGARLAGVSYEEFVKGRKTNPEFKELRQASKSANFGYPGMMGPPKFVEAQRKAGASVCEWFHGTLFGACGERKVTRYRDRELQAPLCYRCIEEASKLRDFYVKTWSEVPVYWRMISQALNTTDALDQFVSGRTRGGLEGPSAANTLFQGLAADGAKLAVRRLTHAMYLDRKSPLYGSRLCVFAHDETIIDIPDLGVDHVDAAAREQARIMVEAMKVYIPDVAVTAEPALMRHWTKEADKKTDDKGRLIPWDTEKTS